MRSILKLVKANIHRGKGSFKGIAFLMMLITFSFACTVSNNDRLSEEIEEKFTKSEVGDLNVFIFDDNLTEEMLSDISRTEHVSSYSKTETIYSMKSVVLGNSSESLTIGLMEQTDDIRILNEACDGYSEIFDLEKGEILLPYKMKKMGCADKGSTLTIKTRDGDVSFKVRGYWEDVLFGSVVQGDYRCIICKEDYDFLKEERLDHVTDDNCYLLMQDHIRIYSDGEITELQLKKAVNHSGELFSAANAAYTRENIGEMIRLYSDIGTRTMFIFVVLLLIVVLITMHNSISSTIEMDYTELGVLKSQGFTSWQISLSYIIQYTLSLMIGAAVGIIASIPASHYLIGIWKDISGLLTDTGVSFLKCGAMCLIIILICMIFITIAASRTGRISPVRAISGGGSDVHFDSRLNTKIRPRPLGFFLALRHLNTHRKSYAGTVAIVALLMFFVGSVMLLAGGLDADNLFEQTGGEISVTDLGGLKLGTLDEIEQEIKKVDPGAELMTESYQRMLVEDELKAVHCYHSKEPVFKPLEGRVPKYGNEIMITKVVSQEMGKEIGDTIKISYLGKTEEFVVTGYFQSVWELGQVTMLTPDGMAKMGFNDINRCTIKLSDKSEKQAVIKMLNEKYAGKLSAAEYEEETGIENLRDAIRILMYAITAAMYAVLLIFASVIVCMVCKRSFIRERKDIGIFKAQGFTSGSLRTQFSVRFTIIALLGSALGCLMCIMFSRTLIQYVLRAVGLTDFTPDYSPIYFIIPSAVLSVCFYVSAYISSARVKQVDVRELITE